MEVVEFSPLRFENKIFVFDRREKTPPYFLSFIYYLLSSHIVSGAVTLNIVRML